MVKVKNLQSKLEYEVSRQDLVSFLLNETSDKSVSLKTRKEESQGMPGIHCNIDLLVEESQLSVHMIASSQLKGKQKLKQRELIQGKALSNVSETIKNAAKLPILAVDLNIQVIQHELNNRRLNH